MKTILHWLKAARLPSQSYIALPLLLGQALHYHRTGELDVWVLVLVQLFGIFDQFYIVFANDYADRELDAKNETFTIFSGGSRVIADGQLPPKHLKWAAHFMALGAIQVGLALGFIWGHWLPLPLIAIGLVLLWMYSYPPVELSYRGGGELLQMVGVGVVLPLIGYTAQSGTVEGFPWALLLAILPVQLSCAMCTALPDAPGDAAGGKRTTAVWMGRSTAQGTIFALNLLAIGAFPMVSWLSPGDPKAYAYVILPLLSSLVMLAIGRKAEPGTRFILVYVFFGILVTLSLLGAMTLDLFLSPPLGS